MSGYGEEYSYNAVPPPPDHAHVQIGVENQPVGVDAMHTAPGQYAASYWPPPDAPVDQSKDAGGVNLAAPGVENPYGESGASGYPVQQPQQQQPVYGWSGDGGGGYPPAGMDLQQQQHQQGVADPNGTGWSAPGMAPMQQNAVQNAEGFQGIGGPYADQHDNNDYKFDPQQLLAQQQDPQQQMYGNVGQHVPVYDAQPFPQASMGLGQNFGQEMMGGDLGAMGEGGNAQRRKRRNRWGPVEAEAPPGEDPGKKKRRSRWETADDSGALTIVPKFPKELTLPGGIRVTLPPHLTGEPVHSDPELKALHEGLAEINRKIINNELDIPPEHERSPSPEPIYDRAGVRLNTREVRMKDKLVLRRNEIIEELIQKDPNYKPPADYKPQKKARKIYIPQKDFPGYNFIGLIIGPRGNTQKRMQKETNTKIAIRGKGSVKEGAARDPKYDYGEDEELHVLITGDKQEDVDMAATMIEKLLQPVDEERNEHKRMQLRELAALNGTLKDDQTCYLCGDSGHRSYECPKKAMDVYKLPTHIQEKVDELYQKDVARIRPEEAGKLDNEYQSFLAEVGGGPPAEMLPGQQAVPAAIQNQASAQARTKRPGDDLPDDCKLYVGNLAPAVNDTMLRQMFEVYGEILHATVLMDLATGISRGYGFVHFTNSMDSRKSAEETNGKVIDGRALVVRLRSEGPPSSRPKYGTAEPDNCKLYVAHLPTAITDTGLKSLFEPHGEVKEVKLITNRVTGEVKGYGFVNMASAVAAQAAIQGLNGYRLDGKVLTVRIAGQRPATGAGSPVAGAPGTIPVRPAPSAIPAVLPGFVPPQAPTGQLPTFPPPVQLPAGVPGLPPPILGPPPPGVGAPGVGAPGVTPPAYIPASFPPLPVQAPPQPYNPNPPLPPQSFNGQAPLMAYGGASGAYIPPPPQQAAEQPPPLPPGPPPSDGNVQSEYERFLREMQGALPS